MDNCQCKCILVLLVNATNVKKMPSTNISITAGLTLSLDYNCSGGKFYCCLGIEID